MAILVGERGGFVVRWIVALIHLIHRALTMWTTTIKRDMVLVRQVTSFLRSEFVIKWFANVDVILAVGTMGLGRRR
jgi:hypothetical protein